MYGYTRLCRLERIGDSNIYGCIVRNTYPWSRRIHFLEEDSLPDEEILKWINMLIAPGASLGGARPKASVIDEKHQLWIAKFPSDLTEPLRAKEYILLQQ